MSYFDKLMSRMRQKAVDMPAMTVKGNRPVDMPPMPIKGNLPVNMPAQEVIGNPGFDFSSNTPQLPMVFDGKDAMPMEFDGVGMPMEFDGTGLPMDFSEGALPPMAVAPTAKPVSESWHNDWLSATSQLNTPAPKSQGLVTSQGAPYFGEGQGAPLFAQFDDVPTKMPGKTTLTGAPDFGQSAGAPLYAQENKRVIDLNAPAGLATHDTNANVIDLDDGYGKLLHEVQTIHDRPKEAPVESYLPLPNIPGMNMGLPIPEQDKPAMPQALEGDFTAAAVKPSSRMRTNSTGGAERGAMQAQNTATTAADPLGDMLSGKEQAATSERDQAKATAEAEKEMSAEEKIAMALVATLPGIFGLVAGGEIAGKAGAAAGFAGGVQGSAQGVGMMNESKQGRRKEALGQAAQAQQRIDQLGGQQLSHKQHLADQQVDQARHDSDQRFTAQQNRAKMAHDRGNEMMREAHDYKIELLRQTGDISKAEIALKAKQSGENPTEFESKSSAYATRMLTALPQTMAAEYERSQELSSALSTKVGWMRAAQSPELQVYADAAESFISGVLRRDSGAAITDEEWEREYRKFFPVYGDKPATLEAKRIRREQETSVMVASAGRSRGAIEQAMQIGATPGNERGKASNDIFSQMTLRAKAQ
jgi:hypothetical protein